MGDCLFRSKEQSVTYTNFLSPTFQGENEAFSQGPVTRAAQGWALKAFTPQPPPVCTTGVKIFYFLLSIKGWELTDETPSCLPSLPQKETAIRRAKPLLLL